MPFFRFLRGTGRDLIETAILALLLFLVVRSSIQNFKVEGFSMDPSLISGEYLIVDKLSYTTSSLGPLEKIFPSIFDSQDDGYLFTGPRRGEVVVFKEPIGGEREFIKRVIGLPSDTIEVKEGTVFVNGYQLPEPYITRAGTYNWPADGSGAQTVPDGHYFVLGDNRDNSSDSHIWGFLPAKNMIGRALFTYWPFSNLGLAPNY